MSREPLSITSRDNPLLKDLRRLTQDSSAYRKLGRFWVEGDHLGRAALLRGWQPRIAAFAQSAWTGASQDLKEWAHGADKTVVLPEAVFDSISGLESPARMGFVFDLPTATEVLPGRPTVVLDRVQDAGNVGSILRSAAAFGFRQVLALSGTAALWGPKVLRAGMGAHFGLHLVEGMGPAELDALGVPLVVTSSHEGALIQHQRLPWPCAWALGHEGQGVSATLQTRAALAVRIGQPGGEESLNVAAAAAICLHASTLSRADNVIQSS